MSPNLVAGLTKTEILQGAKIVKKKFYKAEGKVSVLLNYTKIRSNGHYSGLVIHSVFIATEAHPIFSIKVHNFLEAK